MSTNTTSEPGPIRSFAAACRRLYEHPRWEPLQTRSRRRVISASYVLALASLPLLAWWTERLWPVLIGYAVWVATVVLLGLSTRGLTDRPMSQLDEREKQWRRSVFSEPYWVGVVAGLACGLLLSLSIGASEPMANATLFMILGLLWGVPNVALAWRIPDGADDDA